MEKTQWADTRMVFLGLLIDTLKRLICIPIEKIDRAKDLIEDILLQKTGKVTVHQIQKLAGFLNFLCKAILPGRAFTQRLYALTSNKEGQLLKKHHHIRVTNEVKGDLKMWLNFLNHQSIVARPFMDFSKTYLPEETLLFSDASRSLRKGCGSWCKDEFYSQMWDKDFINKYEPSIQYLELYAVAVAVVLWIHKFKNKKIYMNCDNQAVCKMISNNTLGCRNCMVLIRIITMESLIHNIKVFGLHLESKKNSIADALSRDQWNRFRRLSKKQGFPNYRLKIPDSLWPMEKLWIN